MNCDSLVALLCISRGEEKYHDKNLSSLPQFDKNAIKYLEDEEMIMIDVMTLNYLPTNRGRAYLRHILGLELPTQIWTMP